MAKVRQGQLLSRGNTLGPNSSNFHHSGRRLDRKQEHLKAKQNTKTPTPCCFMSNVSFDTEPQVRERMMGIVSVDRQRHVLPVLFCSIES